MTLYPAPWPEPPRATADEPFQEDVIGREPDGETFELRGPGSDCFPVRGQLLRCGCRVVGEVVAGDEADLSFFDPVGVVTRQSRNPSLRHTQGSFLGDV
jgi:hypothetical protein